MLNFKPNFKCSSLKIFGDPQSHLWDALPNLDEYLAREGLAPHRGRNIVTRKSRFELVQTPKLNHSSPDSFTPNEEGIVHDQLASIFPILDILSRSGDIRDQSRK